MTQKQILPFLLTLFSLTTPLMLKATHNRAGEIHIKQLGPLTIQATIITWTKASSVNADRDTLDICWGDGKCEKVARTNGGGAGEVYPGDLKKNLYVAVHTYKGPGTYKVSMTDPNRIANILNVNPPSSDNVPFHIATTYTFQDPLFGGSNSTPVLNQDPVDNACVGRLFRHNPNASDEDGDSLSYHLIVPLQGLNSLVPNYSFPNQIIPGIDNQINLHPVTGNFVWDAPQREGEYNIAFIIVSWRDGEPIDTTIRDMQILVEECENNPPVVSTIDELCVVAGDTVRFEVTATDPDTANFVRLTAGGAPMNSPFSPAVFYASNNFTAPPVKGTFEWVTTCEHISNLAYSVVFKAVDSVGKQTVRLADLKSVRIKVVGPPPEDVQAVTGQTDVEISWEKPYVCEGAADNYFFGFSVWRREGSNPFAQDTCKPGLAGRGYIPLNIVTKQMKNGRYYFKDTKVERGRTYCYRVLAKFAKNSTSGYPYNFVESLPSEEVCVQLPRDLPLITNVSVEKTDVAAGKMLVQWSKPLADDLDTVINHGPYRYQLYQASGLNGGAMLPVSGASFITNSFAAANDTVFVVNNIDTKNTPWHYRVDFHVRGENTPLGGTNKASSVFLKVASTDKTNILTWEEKVPWNNYRYTVYRLNKNSGLFDSLGQSTAPRYEDKGLINGEEYCYYIRSTGTYSVAGIINPILNLSQEACGIPLDTVPPCVPQLTVTNLCDDQGASMQPPFENRLSWTDPNTACPEKADAISYKVWYAPNENGEFTLLDETSDLNYIHLLNKGLAGCYAVSALDSVGNESRRSAAICVDNCPEYSLPNAFTPNDDEANDFYKPFPGWRFIERVDFQVFNRWGNLVFATEDPAILWDGKNTQGKALSEGTYFYTCKVFEQRVGGVTLRPEILSGYIEIIRGDR